MNQAKTPVRASPQNRLLSAAEFRRLADVPPEVEWFAEDLHVRGTFTFTKPSLIEASFPQEGASRGQDEARQKDQDHGSSRHRSASCCRVCRICHAARGDLGSSV